MYFCECYDRHYTRRLFDGFWKFVWISVNTIFIQISHMFPDSVTLIITMHISYGICPMKYWPLQRNKSTLLEEVPQYCRIQFVCKRTDITRVYCCDIAALYIKHRCSVIFVIVIFIRWVHQNCHSTQQAVLPLKNAFYFCYILVYAHCNTLSHEHYY